MKDELSSRNLAKYGMRRGAYNGANKRRFVLFVNLNNGNERRHEFDSKGQRDDYARVLLREIAFNNELSERMK